MEENQSTNSTQESKGNNKKWIIIAVIGLIIILIAAGGGFLFLNNKEGSITEEMMEGTEEGQMQMQESPNPTSAPEAMMNDSYKDGTYTATGTYVYHAGTESIEVTLTLESGIITEATVVSQAKAPISKQMQADFIANFKPEVIGKNIDEVKLSKVSGSSLTGNGFNAAVDDIKAQASS